VKTITFYSYKGGAGRTLALANAAVFAAIGGAKVVAIDFEGKVTRNVHSLTQKHIPKTSLLPYMASDSSIHNPTNESPPSARPSASTETSQNSNPTATTPNSQTRSTP
jgi:MinD-like ATPase involved in chromosome partitioning or flagellar assembly